MAVSEWAKLREGDTVSLERALGCFDLFVSQGHIESLEEVNWTLILSLKFNLNAEEGHRLVICSMPWQRTFQIETQTLKASLLARKRHLLRPFCD